MRAATWEVHGTGGVTGGRDVTRTAGCHGGDEAGGVGWGGTGHPASATGLGDAGAVVVGVDGCAGRPRGRVEAGAGRTRGEAAVLAERPEPLEAASAGAPAVPATPVTAVSAVATSTTDPTAHDHLIRPDRSTVHSRDQPGQTLGRPTPAMMPRRSWVRGSEGSRRPTLPACGAIRCATRPRMRHVKHGRYHAPYLRRGVRFRATASLMSALNARSLIFSPS